MGTSVLQAVWDKTVARFETCWQSMHQSVAIMHHRSPGWRKKAEEVHGQNCAAAFRRGQCIGRESWKALMGIELAYLLCKGRVGNHDSLACVVPLPVDTTQRRGVLLLEPVLGQRAEEAHMAGEEAASSGGGQLPDGEPEHRQKY